MCVNAAYFLTPKSDVSYVYDDSSLRQALEKLRRSGFTAIPVIDRDGRYAGTLREGDFLWYLVESDEGLRAHSLKDLEGIRLKNILQPEQFPAVPITVSMEVVIRRAMQQNFVPVVDDEGNFIGIITRMALLKHLSDPRYRGEGVLGKPAGALPEYAAGLHPAALR